MNILGAFGNLYMASLLVLLAAGSLYAIYYLLKSTYTSLRGTKPQKAKTTASAQNIRGGDSFMNSNGWLKLAAFSFVGLIISVILLNVTNPGSTNDQHSNHVNGTGTTSGMIQGTVNSGVTMDQMNSMMQQMGQLQQQMMQMQQQFMGQQGSMGTGSSGGMGSMGGMNGGMGSMGSMGGSSGGGMGMM